MIKLDLGPELAELPLICGICGKESGTLIPSGTELMCPNCHRALEGLLNALESQEDRTGAGPEEEVDGE